MKRSQGIFGDVKDDAAGPELRREYGAAQGQGWGTVLGLPQLAEVLEEFSFGEDASFVTH